MVRAGVRAGLVALCLFISLLLGALTAEATTVGVDSLQRPADTSGSIETWVRTRLKPGGEQGIVRIGETMGDLTQQEEEWATQLGATYYVTDQTSFWSEWTFVQRHRQSILRIDEAKEIREWRRSRSVGVVGLRHRWAPSSSLDPHLGISMTTDGSTQADVSIVRIMDPALVSVSVARSFGSRGASSGDTESGWLDISGGMGLVVNDKMTLYFGVGHRRPIGLEELSTSSFTVKWSWEVDPQHHHYIGVWGGLSHTGDQGGVSLGMEWNHRFSTAKKS